ncbi:hypothetical protein QCA50_003198 [Cerrena zonata]|uniref:Pali-domain-containing protein n=1 Tax=Cerrena zonata TaxID=2478898 RepID=A0AAW0GP67_9APHY
MRWNLFPPVFFLCAFVLTLLASLSTPTIHTIDLFRFYVTPPSTHRLTWRFGMTGFCFSVPVDLPVSKDTTSCNPLGLGYPLRVVTTDPTTGTEVGETIIMSRSLSRALILNPLSSAIAAIAFILTLSQLILRTGNHRWLPLSVVVISSVSALLTTVAFITDAAIAAHAIRLLSSSVFVPSGSITSADWGNALWIASGGMIAGWFGVLSVVFEYMKQSKINAKLTNTY